MRDEVQVLSATDPPYVLNRRVWYWVEFRGQRSERLNDWASVAACAEAIRAEDDGVLIDRSDKGTYLHLTV